jgi:hypothetical protein
LTPNHVVDYFRELSNFFSSFRKGREVVIVRN